MQTIQNAIGGKLVTSTSSRTSAGGTSPLRVKEAVEAARKELGL